MCGAECVNFIACSHHRRGQDKLSCLVLSASAVWTVLSCLVPVFSNPQYIWDWTVANWKLSRDTTKLSCLQFTPLTRTRQDKAVLSCPCQRCEQAITHSVTQPLTQVQSSTLRCSGSFSAYLEFLKGPSSMEVPQWVLWYPGTDALLLTLYSFLVQIIKYIAFWHMIEESKNCSANCRPCVTQRWDLHVVMKRKFF